MLLTTPFLQILITEIMEQSAMAIGTMRFEQKPDGTYRPLPRPAKSMKTTAAAEPAAEPTAEPAAKLAPEPVAEPASKA